MGYRRCLVLTTDGGDGCGEVTDGGDGCGEVTDGGNGCGELAYYVLPLEEDCSDGGSVPILGVLGVCRCVCLV